MATPYLQYGQDGLSGFDATGVRRIWLDPVNLLFSFFDANGIPRCEIGNLPARGVNALGIPASPAHWGFRVNDASGNPLYDSQGVIGSTVLQQVGGTIQFPGAVATAAYVTISGSSATFNVSRASGTYGIWLSAICSYVGTGQASGYVSLFVDGVDNHGVNSLNLRWNGLVAAGGSTQGGLAGPIILSNGSHTIDLRCKQDGNTGTSQFFVAAYQTTVFQWGG